MNLLRIITAAAVAIGTTVFVAIPVLGVSYGGGGIQGYSSETPLDKGTVVQLVDKDNKAVKVASQKELSRMFGIVIEKSQLPFTITDEGLKNETFVAATGTYDALVSTQGGVISSGDYLTMSAINGVLMKAGTEEETVFGRANSGFDGKGVVLGTSTLKDVNGKENQKVTLGSIPVTIDVKKNPNEKSTEVDILEQLRRVGKQIAEKEVSAVRIYLSMAITAISLIAAIAVIYSGVRNSIISIGRNPMSKKTIFRALLEIILTSILILVIGLFAVYLLLKL